jgi:hypothetical protein
VIAGVGQLLLRVGVVRIQAHGLFQLVDGSSALALVEGVPALLLQALAELVQGRLGHGRVGAGGFFRQADRTVEALGRPSLLGLVKSVCSLQPSAGPA